jgi:hypothetical protein
MKMNMFFRFVLLGMVSTALHNVSAGSAVGTDSRGHNVYSFGHSKEIAKRRVLAEARRKGWGNVRIVAANDMPGYEQSQLLFIPMVTGRFLGIAVGKWSITEADTVAINECRKAGGSKPQVKWTWKGQLWL